MSTDYGLEELKQLKLGVPRWGGFFRLETDPVVRLWLGVGNIKPGVNALDPIDGGTYRGFGELTDLPGFTSFCDGGSEKKTFVISGIRPTIFEKIAPNLTAQQVAIRDRPLSVGYGIMGASWQLLGPVRWQWHGYADVLGARMATVTSVQSPELWTIELTASDAFVHRGASRRDYWTDQDHQAEFPGDRIFERMVRNAQGVVKAWPPG